MRCDGASEEDSEELLAPALALEAARVAGSPAARRDDASAWRSCLRSASKTRCSAPRDAARERAIEGSKVGVVTAVGDGDGGGWRSPRHQHQHEDKHSRGADHS